MKRSQSKVIFSLNTCVFVFCSFVGQVNAQANKQISLNECASAAVSNKHCDYYIKGYVDALLALDDLTSNYQFSAFEERAFNTRVSKIRQSNYLLKELNLCLPEKISKNDILTLLGKEQTLKNELLKALQAKYPCRPKTSTNN